MVRGALGVLGRLLAFVSLITALVSLYGLLTGQWAVFLQYALVTAVLRAAGFGCAYLLVWHEERQEAREYREYREYRDSALWRD